MGPERYVYYRVAPTPALREAVLAMQRALRERHRGLETRLLARADARGGETWMESYAAPQRAGGVDAALGAEIESSMTAALGAAIVGERHVETFVPCAS